MYSGSAEPTASVIAAIGVIGKLHRVVMLIIEVILVSRILSRQ